MAQSNHLTGITGIEFDLNPRQHPTTAALKMTRSLSRPVVSKSGAYTATATDWLILGTGGAGGITITLPTAVGFAGREYVVKKIDNGAGAVNVASTSAQTFDGAASPYASLSAQWKYARFVSDGANWVILGAG